MIVGIDLGTTNSAVGVMTADGPKLIPNSIGRMLTPSVVGVDPGGTILVGQAAKELQVVAPERCASVFKRDMGSDVIRWLGGKKLGAIELSSLVLGSLRQDACSHLNREVDRAVITVPAYFNNEQRRATIEAGKMAGFRVERIINEPTAASLAYGIHETTDRRTVAVFDLGGGTFDISIVEFFEGAIEVQASAGEAILGGEDFTRAIVREVLRQRSLVYEHVELKQPKLLSRLLQQCELAKRQLSQTDKAEVRIPNRNGELLDNSPRVTIDRELINRCCGPILRLIDSPVRRALGDAKLTREQIEQVILVGGATRMPVVVDLVKELFRKTPVCSINPDEVVALGAAIQSGLIGKNAALEDLVVVDVAPFTLGVEVAKEMGGEYRQGYFSPLIHRNTVIPTSRSSQFTTIEPNQTQLELRIFQGESRRVEENLLLGSLNVRGFPRAGKCQTVTVRFTYDNNGVLEIDAVIDATGNSFRLLITKHASHLNERELAEAVQRMQALKIHPRSDTVNQFTLKRAERLYQELPVFMRHALTDRIDAFESALDGQEHEQIKLHREQLELFLSAFDDLEQNDNA
jgi:molecular chaperone HscC